MSGAWTQKSETWFVNFARERFVPATTPSPVDGIWLGSQQITAKALTRIQVVVHSDIRGKEYCTMDALDIYTMGLECTDVAFKGNELSFNVPVAGEHWLGTLSPDGKTLTGAVKARLVNGNTSEEISSPLNLARQTALTPEKPLPQTTYDPAIPPVQAAELKSVLDRDLTDALKTGELASSTGAGVSIAVYEHGVSNIFSYGTARPDSIYEIGSMTKTFTGLLLSQLAVQGTVRLDQPVRELLPPGTVAKPDVPEITLLDLATQRSGLPPMPDNISVANLDDPYADYHAADLFAYLAKHGVTNSSHAISSFGSLGYGLLGVSLASRTGLTYAELLKKEITGPLGMKDTVVSLSPEQQIRFIPGRHDQFHNPARPWNSDALAGAIALRSTAGDMLTYLEANLHPERLKLTGGSVACTTLGAAIGQSLRPQTELLHGIQIALGWLYEDSTGNYWHNGATAAYSSYAFFNSKGDFAAAILLNTSPGVNGSFVEVLGRHISQRLAGNPAIHLSH